MVAPCPPLTPDALLASHCWTWSGGWAPERWVSFGAMHEVPDWALLIELMQVIRNQVE